MEMTKLSEVAEKLGITEKMLVNEHKRGNLPVIRIGNTRYVRSEVVETWIASKEIAKPVKRKLTPAHIKAIKDAAAAKRAAKK